MLKLTRWGEFVNRYSVMVPMFLWISIYRHISHLIDTEQDWSFFAGELVAGLQALMDEEGQDSIYRILAEAEERGE